MLFNSWHFALFFPVVFALYWALPHRFRLYLLLIASYYFYMCWNVQYVALILFTTLVSYSAARLVARTQSQRIKKLILTLSLLACLGVLFVFKYFNFVASSVVDFLNMFTLHLHPMTLKLLLPVGISFYTFQTLSYFIDVYRGHVTTERNFIIYALFVSYFPQLVAGPIERTNNLLPQIKSPHDFNYEQAVYGIKLMIWGFFKKLAIADVLAVYVDKVFADLHSYEGFALVLATFFFSVQIYCDFSGYSDIARGCSKMLGIDLMENFRSPYFSASIHEFWSRWHISLSTWFRDYVYIPLGGNRCSKFRHNVNLMLTFIVSGLWHGANWTFIIWGTIHGVAQVLENTFAHREIKAHGLAWMLRVVLTFTFVTLAWVFFRAQNLDDALYIFAHSLDSITNITPYLKEGFRHAREAGASARKALYLISLLAAYDYSSLKHDCLNALATKTAPLRWSVYVFSIMLLLVLIRVKEAHEFVYFQF